VESSGFLDKTAEKSQRRYPRVCGQFRGAAGASAVRTVVVRSPVSVLSTDDSVPNDDSDPEFNHSI